MVKDTSACCVRWLLSARGHCQPTVIHISLLVIRILPKPDLSEGLAKLLLHALSSDGSFPFLDDPPDALDIEALTCRSVVYNFAMHFAFAFGRAHAALRLPAPSS